MCKFFAFYLERNCRSDLEYLRSQNDNYQLGLNISDGEYVRLTYEEAAGILKKMDLFKDFFDGPEPVNLNAQMERTLVETMNNRPVFVTHFPMQMKPFYMKSIGGKVCQWGRIIFI